MHYTPKFTLQARGVFDVEERRKLVEAAGSIPVQGVGVSNMVYLMWRGAEILYRLVEAPQCKLWAVWTC